MMMSYERRRFGGFVQVFDELGFDRLDALKLSQPFRLLKLVMPHGSAELVARVSSYMRGAAIMYV
jgi:hypothetical protein